MIKPPRFTRNTAREQELPLLSTLVDAPRRRRDQTVSANADARPVPGAHTPAIVGSNNTTGLSPTLFTVSHLKNKPSAPSRSSSVAPSRPSSTAPRSGTLNTLHRQPTPPPLREPPPHISPTTTTATRCREMKLGIPTLQAAPDQGALRPAALKAWIARCEDVFEGYEDLNNKTLKARTKILQAGLRVEEPSVSSWWTDNRAELKALSSWTEFTTRLCDRFIPSNWRVDALEEFYLAHQGSDTFPVFVARLQAARNSLAGAGTCYAISNVVMKNYLLFFCASRLRRRVLAIPDFKLHELRVDTLINTLTTTWASMVEEGIVPTGTRAARPMTSATGASSAVNVPMSGGLPPLSEAERQRLCELKGCFHCRLHPGSLGWKAHTARDCPGDPSRNISARASALPVAAVNTVGVDEGSFFSAAVALRMEDDQPLSCIYSTETSENESD
ncbi:hypothetical protein PHLGIDRAFT_115294 [Phlebiopsis gigantea 11061_1 CR5-6]|uniref:Retrotransposon gag domain-containing protein n=1 Tax=Phlebiopsis gigantea (strain 11061_1 CR5-6) TaxID=745531 RepID=A0A0C3S491_PHLG1|nr:hypothetical protein PHLGIDRAFT_115294 [Phlebiopsis gigantea 11061_1 CR5-6]